MKKIAVLGVTGVIGRQTVEVIKAHPERFTLTAFSFYQNIERGKQLIKEFAPAYVAVSDQATAEQLAKEFPKTSFVWGIDGMCQIAGATEIDIVVVAVVGSVGLQPVLKALKERQRVALANKESLVAGGKLIMELVHQGLGELVPIDSEHSAIFQCLNGNTKDQAVAELILTASGGSLRNYQRAELKNVTIEQALKHPNWQMGPKITIDSATMMNKGLEVMEAYWLFGVDYDKINVILHKTSDVHSCVKFIDGSYLMQVGPKDPKQPIQYALTYPERVPVLPQMPFSLLNQSFSFEKMDLARFPLLKLAYEVGRAGECLPAVFNYANEIAVKAFLQGKISFLAIEYLVEKAVNQIANHALTSIEDLLTIEKQTKQLVAEMIKKGMKP